MTLTYVYADQTAVLGPLATYAEPHAYDLCIEHSERLSAPRGWEVLRLATGPVDEGPSNDDLLALVPGVHTAVCDRAMQAFGAMGLTPDTPRADSWTWGRALRFADGPDEVHRDAIAKLELKKYQ